MYMYNIHGNNINSSNCSQNIKFNNKFKFNNNPTCSSDLFLCPTNYIFKSWLEHCC